MSGSTFNTLFDPSVVGAPQNTLAPQPTWADAWQFNAEHAQAELERQRAISEQRGLWAQGGPTPAGARDAAQQTAMGVIMGTTAPKPGFTAFHGSPYDFNAFDASKIGTGEGAQAYGHGMYLAENERIAKSYRDDLTTKQPSPELIAAQNAYNRAYNAVGDVTGGTQQQFDAAIAARDAARANMERVKADWEAQPKPTGRMYEVGVNADPAHFLDWDKPLSEQSPLVLDKIRNLQARGLLPKGWTDEDMAALTGQHLYQELRHTSGSDAKSSALLAAPVPGTGQGVPGIRYLDAGSRSAGTGSRNAVIFDPATMEILRKYGLAGLMAGGAGAAATQGDNGS